MDNTIMKSLKIFKLEAKLPIIQGSMGIGISISGLYLLLLMKGALVLLRQLVWACMNRTTKKVDSGCKTKLRGEDKKAFKKKRLI